MLQAHMTNVLDICRDRVAACYRLLIRSKELIDIHRFHKELLLTPYSDTTFRSTQRACNKG